MLYQEIRPTKFSEVVGNRSTVKALELLSKRAPKDRPHTILLSGPKGCGKTTLAHILASTFGTNGDNIRELNTANVRGIETVRDIISDLNFVPFGGGSVSYILDECFPGQTRVLTDYNKCTTIENIFNSQKIQEILSYDIEQKKIIKKKIIRKIKRKISEKLVKTFIRDGEKEYWIYSTKNHKFYVIGKGYIEAENLAPGDKLIKYDGEFTFFQKEKKRSFVGKRSGICKYCRKYFDHVRPHEILIHEISKNKKQVISQTISEARKKFEKTEGGRKNREKLSLSHRGKNNPLFRNNSAGLKKLRKAMKKRWENLPSSVKEEQIKRFVNAPKYKNIPNRPEKGIISMGIPNVEYVGNGSFFLTLKIKGKNHHKNPDFVVRKRDENGKILSANKFIEVMDLEYWHKENWKDIEEGYKKLGFDILILNAKEVVEDSLSCRAKIESFANNSYVEVITTPRSKSGRKKNRKRNFKSRGNQYVYNIEIEGTHNYFVLAQSRGKAWSNSSIPILVSNCHQITRDAQQALLKETEDTPKHVYFILCTTDPEKILPTLRNRCTEYKVEQLKSRDIITILERACKIKNLTVDSSILEVIASNCERTPRSALVMLEKIIGMTDLDEIAEAIASEINIQEGGDFIHLCKLLLMLPEKRRNEWKKVLAEVEKLQQEPEQIRTGILTFLRKQLMKIEDKDTGYAEDISRTMQILSYSTFYGGKNVLVSLLMQVCLGNKTV